MNLRVELTLAVRIGPLWYLLLKLILLQCYTFLEPVEVVLVDSRAILARTVVTQGSVRVAQLTASPYSVR